MHSSRGIPLCRGRAHAVALSIAACAIGAGAISTGVSAAVPAPSGTTLIDEKTLIRQAVPTPDGRWILAVVGKERSFRMLNVAEGGSRTWEEGSEGVGSLAISPDSTTVAVGRQSGHVEVRELVSGKMLRSFHVVSEEHPEPFVLGPGSGGESALHISPDGKILAATDWTLSVSLWRWPEGTLIGRVRNAGKERHQGLGGMSFGADSKTLFNLCVGVEATGFVSIWDLPSGKLKHSFVPPRTNGVMAVSPDGRFVATGDSFNRWISVWNVESLPKNVAAPMLPGKNCNSLAFSPDGRQLAAVSTVMGHEEPTIALWESPSGRKIREWPASDGLWLGGVLFYSPDGKSLYSGGQLEGLTRWDLPPSP